MDARNRDGRGAFGRVVACSTALVLAMTVLVLSTASAQPVDEPVDESDEPYLDLVDQDMTVDADGTFRITFRIGGNLDRLDFPSATTSTTTSTTTTTTSTTTTTTTTTTLPAVDSEPVPDATVSTGEATGSPPAPTTAPAVTTTTTTTLPAPIDVALDIINYEPLDRRGAGVATLQTIIGPNSRLDALGPSIDGVRITNVRDLIGFDEENNPVITIEIATDGNGVPSVGERLEMTEAGLTPLRIELRVDDRVAAVFGTVIDRQPDTNDRIDLATPIDLAVVALVPRPDVEADDPLAVIDGVASPEAAAQILEETEEPFTALEQLVRDVDVPVLAEIAPIVLGTHLDIRNDADMLRSAFADDELVAVATGSLNVSSAVSIGLTDAVSRQVALGEEALTDLLPLTPTRRDVWIATEPISAGGAQVLRNLGYRAIVMTPELAGTLSPTTTGTDGSTPQITDRFIEVPLPDGRTIDVIVIDPLSELLTTAATDEVLEDSSALIWALRTTASMLLDHRRAGGSIQRSRVLSTPDLTAPDPRLVAALASVAQKTPTLRFTRATALAGVTDTAPLFDRAFPDSAGPDLTARVQRITDTALALASVGSMLSPDDTRPASWERTLSSLRSTAVRETTANDTLDGLLDEAEALVGAVQLPAPFRFTLTGRSGVIPVRLTNTSDEPLDVILRLSSPKLEFPDGEERVTLRPDDDTDVPVRVSARSNGTSAIRLEVVTPLGVQIGDPVTITSRVNALTGLGQVLTGGFILILLTWWFNNWRSKRRRDDEHDDPAHIGAQEDVANSGTNLSGL